MALSPSSHAISATPYTPHESRSVVSPPPSSFIALEGSPDASHAFAVRRRKASL